jgi:hypothetical protein
VRDPPGVPPFDEADEGREPQPYAPKPGAQEKGVLEDFLHRAVCGEGIPLAEAQHQITTDRCRVCPG